MHPNRHRRMMPACGGLPALDKTAASVTAQQKGGSGCTGSGCRSHDPNIDPVKTTAAVRKSAVFLSALAILMSAIVAPGHAVAPTDPALADTQDQAFASAIRQSIGSPARADLDDEATVRLAEGLLLVPKEPAARLLSAMDQTVPANFSGLLLGPEGMDAQGKIRFVPAGFIDSDAALAWTADDMLASLRATVERSNPGRLKANLSEREARRWIQPPHYDPEAHQLSWAALIVSKGAPRDTDGEVTYHGLGFGRDGYVQLSVVSSVQKADHMVHMVDGFLSGLNFVPGKAYIDAAPADRKAKDGLAGAMEIDKLHKNQMDGGFWSSDSVVPVVGSVVASIGALSLFFSVQRHRRRQSRRV
jgi:uncharacterized membrane-anchored protein